MSMVCLGMAAAVALIMWIAGRNKTKTMTMVLS